MTLDKDKYGAVYIDDIDDPHICFDKSPDDNVKAVRHYEQRWTVEDDKGIKYDALCLATEGYNAWLGFLSKYGIVVLK